MGLDASDGNSRVWVYFDKDSQLIETCDSMNILTQVQTQQVYFVYNKVSMDQNNPAGHEEELREN